MKKRNKRKRVYKLEDSDSSSESEDEDNEISSVENNIYFYGSVSRQNSLKLNKELEKVKNFVKKNMYLDCINLYIQSEGGEVFAAISTMNYIKNLDIKVCTIIDGFVASAATLIALGGHEIWMQKHSTVLIHQMTTGFYGKYEEFMDEVNNSKSVMEKLKDIYLSETNIPPKELEKLLQRDIYLDSDKCLMYDIVHYIY